MSDLLADLALRCETDTQTQKSVLWFLAYRQNPKTGQNNWSVPNMAKQLSMSDRSVQKSIRYLCASVEEGGIAVLRRTPRPNNSCNYFVVEAALRARANIEAPPNPEGEPETLEGGEPNSPLAVDGGESDSPLQEENEPNSPAGEHGSPLGVNEVRPKESKEIEKEDTHTHQEGDDKFEIIKMLHANGFDVSVKDSKLLDLVGCGADLQLFKKAVDSSIKKNNMRLGYLFGTVQNMLCDLRNVKPVLSLVQNSTPPLASKQDELVEQASLKLKEKKELFSQFQTFTLACAVLARDDCAGLIESAWNGHALLREFKGDKYKNPRTHWVWVNFKAWAAANRPDVIGDALFEPHHKDFDAWLDWDSGQQNIKACG